MIVEARDGATFRLRWAIWSDPNLWSEELIESSLPLLLTGLEQREEAGEGVSFSISLALAGTLFTSKTLSIEGRGG